MKSRNQIYLENRIKEAAKFIIDNKTTIRETAKHIGVSKSTIHRDIRKKLKEIDYNLYNSVNVILAENWEEKYIRGGRATKEKYKSLKTLN